MTFSLALLALVAAAAFGAICAVAGALWMKARTAPALREATRDREQLLDLAEAWIWRTDAELRVTLWRPPARRAAAWGEPTPVGHRLAEVAVAEGAAVSPPLLARQMAAQAPVAEQRVVLRLEGAARAWSLRAEPCHDGAGRFTGYVGSALPAEACEAAAPGRAAIAAAPEPAEPAPEAAVPAPQDTADQESFVYSVSHDLRAPIRVVEGFARILKEDYGRFLDRIGNDHTDRILAAAARMNSMIDALLALSRLQSQPLKRQPVDLSQLATYILEDLRSEAPERVVETDIEPGLVVTGDPTLMRVAVENLVGNAWKYSARMPITRIALRSTIHDGRTAYVISDNGAGFDMRFADRLFGVFQRLHSAKDFQGTGVGLASVRRIIRRHGGDIWAESEVGKGARFYFTIP
jgi:signal transduction histidine kinase